jgi:hypothetical protein
MADGKCANSRKKDGTCPAAGKGALICKGTDCPGWKRGVTK